MRMALAGLLVALLTGCQTRQLVPTPNLFLKTSIDPFEKVPEVYRNNEVDVLYLTDRKQKGQRENYVEYGVERSLSVAWGSVIVRMGQDIDWSTLSAASDLF